MRHWARLLLLLCSLVAISMAAEMTDMQLVLKSSLPSVSASVAAVSENAEKAENAVAEEAETNEEQNNDEDEDEDENAAVEIREDEAKEAEAEANDDNEETKLAAQESTQIPSGVSDTESGSESASDAEQSGDILEEDFEEDVDADQDDIFFKRKLDKKLDAYLVKMKADLPAQISKFVSKYSLHDMTPGLTLLDSVFCGLFAKDVYENKSKLDFVHMGIHALHFLNDRKTHTQARVWYSDRLETVWIAFRGMQFTEIKDIITNLKARLTKCKLVKDCKGRVHKGWQEVIQRVQKQLFDTIDPYVSKGYRVVITGHSQGAALSTLFAIPFEQYFSDKYNRPVVPNVRVFASPRVGDQSFVQFAEPRLPAFTQYATEYKSRACGIFDSDSHQTDVETDADADADSDQALPAERPMSEIASMLERVSDQALQDSQKFLDLATAVVEAGNEAEAEVDADGEIDSIADVDADADADVDAYGRSLRRAFRRAGRFIRRTARRVARGVRRVAKKVGSKLKTWVKKAASGIKHAKAAFKKFGGKLKEGFKKTWKKVSSNLKSAVKAIGDGIKKVAKKGWSIAKKVIKKIGKVIFRHKSVKDLVTTLPPRVLGYRHVGHRLTLPCPYSCTKPCCSLTHLFGSVICHQMNPYLTEVHKQFVVELNK